ncbi:ACT domain-containing protein, partial [Kingella kingae]|uniref:ACT domain-containing protein n=1 Tax=Kingella kingae TaxID=504 RepID=UPI00254EDF13
MCIRDSLITADTENRVPHLAFQPSQVVEQTFVPMDEISSSYYLRVQVADKAGVLGAIASLLAKENVSIEALIQKAVLDNNQAEIVILTHNTIEKNVKAAIKAIEAQDTVSSPVTLIRMETLNG